ncbi:MAG: DciA family protein [Phycisphaerales bacterium]
MADASRQIDALRKHRVAAGVADLSLAAAMGSQAKELRSRARSLGAVGGAFARLVPRTVQERCVLVGMKAGVLTVRCDDDAARFELDRWLRTGGELELVKATPTTLAKVRIARSGRT